MKSDIEIARQAKMLPITEVAKKAGIGEDDLESLGQESDFLEPHCKCVEIMLQGLEHLRIGPIGDGGTGVL